MRYNHNFYPLATFWEAVQRGGYLGARVGLQSALAWTIAYLLVFLNAQLAFVTDIFSKQIDLDTFYDVLNSVIVSFVGFVILGSVPVGVLSFALGCVIGGVSVVPYIGTHAWVRSCIGFSVVLMLLTLTFPLLHPILETDMWLYFPLLTALLMVNAIFLSGGAIWLSIWLPLGMWDMERKETPFGEKPVVYSTVWLRFLRKFQGRTF